LRKFLEYKANDSKISNSLIGFENQEKYADEKINLDISAMAQEKSSY
jgi:hypothetical protein